MSLIIHATHLTLHAEATRLEARRAALQQELAQLDEVLPSLRLFLEKLGPLDLPALPPVPPVPTVKPRESAAAPPPTPPKKPAIPPSPVFTVDYQPGGPWDRLTPTRQSAAPPEPTPPPMAPPTSPPPTPTPATVGGPGTPARPGPGKSVQWTRKKTPHDFLPPFHTTRSVILKWVIGESEVTTLQMGRRFPGKEPNLLRKFYDRGILERALVPGETRMYRYRAPADVKDAFTRDFNREYRE